MQIGFNNIFSGSKAPSMSLLNNFTDQTFQSVLFMVNALLIKFTNNITNKNNFEDSYYLVKHFPNFTLLD